MTVRKVIRKIVRIDESKCDGCGLCIPACPEGALQIVDGKAKLVDERYCDGLGACIKECPKGAITIEERETHEFDEEAVKKRMEEVSCIRYHVSKQLVPSSKSELSQWPVKLILVNPKASFFENSNLLIVADCVPFAYANFHDDFLKGKIVLTGCPKFDEAQLYFEKLVEIFRNFNLKSVEVVRMEVPCCSGLLYITEEALKPANRNLGVKETVIGIKGKIVSSSMK